MIACTALAVIGLFDARAEGDVPGIRFDPDAAAIDLSGRPLLFDEPFDSVDVSAWRETDTRWIAHTPWYGDFGDATFVDPDPVAGFPFRSIDGALRIEARRNDEGQWESGLLSAVDPDGEGFATPTGYFEARMDLPEGPGTWPAFWLGSVARPDGHSGEIDIVEFYGHSPLAYSSVWHVWFKDPVTGEGAHPAFEGREIVVGEGLTDGFHTWGVDITESELVYYFDRREVWRTPRRSEFDGLAFYPLVNLALGSGWPIDETPDPTWLFVDYVRVWGAAAVDDSSPD